MMDDLSIFIVGIIFLLTGLITLLSYKDFIFKSLGKIIPLYSRDNGGKSTNLFQSSSLEVATSCESSSVALYESAVSAETLKEQTIQLTPCLRAGFVQFDNFFTPAEHGQLLSYVKKRESSFERATTTTGKFAERSSLVLYSFPEFSNLIISRIQTLFPVILSKLDLPFFDIELIESQLTAHNEGDYYKLHRDNGSEKMKNRVLTYVYYFNKTPKAFTGGELLLYDSKIVNNNLVPAESFQTIKPRNNSIVFFLSHHFHEVLPIDCQSGKFIDSRFTINGWIRSDKRLFT